MTNKDKREYFRLFSSRVVDFVVGNRAYRGSIENKSDSGVFIKTMGRFLVGQDVSMKYESPIFMNERRTGKIVRVTPEGIGVQFTNSVNRKEKSVL